MLEMELQEDKNSFSEYSDQMIEFGTDDVKPWKPIINELEVSKITNF